MLAFACSSVACADAQAGTTIHMPSAIAIELAGLNPSSNGCSSLDVWVYGDNIYLDAFLLCWDRKVIRVIPSDESYSRIVDFG